MRQAPSWRKLNLHLSLFKKKRKLPRKLLKRYDPCCTMPQAYNASKVVQEYKKDDLASGSDDERRINKAEKLAEKKGTLTKKPRGQKAPTRAAPGSGYQQQRYPQFQRSYGRSQSNVAPV